MFTFNKLQTAIDAFNKTITSKKTNVGSFVNNEKAFSKRYKADKLILDAYLTLHMLLLDEKNIQHDVSYYKQKIQQHQLDVAGLKQNLSSGKFYRIKRILYEINENHGYVAAFHGLREHENRFFNKYHSDWDDKKLMSYLAKSTQLIHHDILTLSAAVQQSDECQYPVGHSSMEQQWQAHNTPHTPYIKFIWKLAQHPYYQVMLGEHEPATLRQSDSVAQTTSGIDTATTQWLRQSESQFQQLQKKTSQSVSWELVLRKLDEHIHDDPTLQAYVNWLQDVQVRAKLSAWPESVTLLTALDIFTKHHLNKRPNLAVHELVSSWMRVLLATVNGHALLQRAWLLNMKQGEQYELQIKLNELYQHSSYDESRLMLTPEPSQLKVFASSHYQHQLPSLQQHVSLWRVFQQYFVRHQWLYEQQTQVKLFVGLKDYALIGSELHHALQALSQQMQQPSNDVSYMALLQSYLQYMPTADTYQSTGFSTDYVRYLANFMLQNRGYHGQMMLAELVDDVVSQHLPITEKSLRHHNCHFKKWDCFRAKGDYPFHQLSNQLQQLQKQTKTIMQKSDAETLGITTYDSAQQQYVLQQLSLYIELYYLLNKVQGWLAFQLNQSMDQQAISLLRLGALANFLKVIIVELRCDIQANSTLEHCFQLLQRKLMTSFKEASQISVH
tara:strand:- start:35105 stop:37111 length:2007 start_codon:yes stop_codon:yes gene_type:complete